ncbi:SIR2 family protein [Telluria beijingensis]|uniref:SIR2 family protein n=1 Tax=Telluria beijingensis TaxID=3068633 RepID=UPI0027955335|nr:SIR2 family protein [Massilia sp. REN29]
MSNATNNGYRVGAQSEWFDKLPDGKDLDAMVLRVRKIIEPWLTAVFQAEHLNLLLGSGFTTAIGYLCDATATGMGTRPLGTRFDEKIDSFAASGAAKMGRGAPNIEDQFRTAFALLEGLNIGGKFEDINSLKTALDSRMSEFLSSLFSTERGIASSEETKWRGAVTALQSFLLSFASRAASRERLHIFTTNYDRLIEYGCDLAGIRVIDRFVGALEPAFRSSRLDCDYHYNPPGIRGEPRFMEGVIRLTKLHGSLDWAMDNRTGNIVRRGIPFGPADHSPYIPNSPVDTVMIYPNATKDVETTAYPYAELFRDMAAALCRPNSVLVLYGYGFGDDHLNRVLLDMLVIPSTHIVVISYSMDARLTAFLHRAGREAQITLLIGPHFADLTKLTEEYLPKPAIDHISSRMSELLRNRSYSRADESPVTREESLTEGEA